MQTSNKNDEYKLDNSNSNTINLIPETEIKKEKKLDSGGYANVYAGFWHNREVAIKTLLPHKLAKYKEKFNHEISMSTQFNHPNVVTTYGAYASAAKPENMSMVMERMKYSLAHFIVNENKKPLGYCGLTHSIMYQAANGIKYIHEQSIVHRDIKFQNFLVGNENNEIQIKLCDFGLAVKVDGNFIDKERLGTGCYHSPEIIHNYQYSYSSDIWAFGCTFQEVITRVNCYYPSYSSYSDDGPSRDDYYSAILEGKREPLPYDTNRLFKQIIDECGRYDWELRPKAEEIVNQLKPR